MRPNLEDASEALETLARRSDGLLHFVQNHRRLTRRFDVQLEIVPVQRVFSRLQRLLADELTTRYITLLSEVTPQTLEVSVDPGLLDQALINLVRNAMEALRDAQKALEAKFGEPRKAAIVWRPQNTISVDDEAGEKILKLIGALEENDDVQNVTANFEVSDALIAKLGG